MLGTIIGIICLAALPVLLIGITVSGIYDFVMFKKHDTMTKEEKRRINKELRAERKANWKQLVQGCK